MPGMKTFVFLSVMCLLWSKTFGIYGGCMSYSTSETDVPGRIKVSFLYFKINILSLNFKRWLDLTECSG